MVIVTSTVFRKISNTDIQSEKPPWNLHDMKPPSNYLTLNSCHREKILEFLHSDHLENEKLPDNPCTELTKLNISRQTAVLKTTRVLPCSNHNPACEDSMVEICKMYDKFLSESGKKWSWVVFDGGPMISFLKLQRTCPNEYNKLHPIVGALHEDVLSWYYLHSSGLSWSLGTCVRTHEAKLCQRLGGEKHS